MKSEHLGNAGSSKDKGHHFSVGGKMCRVGGAGSRASWWGLLRTSGPGKLAPASQLLCWLKLGAGWGVHTQGEVPPHPGHCHPYSWSPREDRS